VFSRRPVAATEIEHRREQRVAELLRDRNAAVARHQRVAAEHVVRPALLGPAGDDQHRRVALLDLLRDLGVRQQFELDDVLGVDRGLRCGCATSNAEDISKDRE
jgi:hypothetical protein